jgi:hypothetical protein
VWVRVPPALLCKGNPEEDDYEDEEPDDPFHGNDGAADADEQNMEIEIERHPERAEGTGLYRTLIVVEVLSKSVVTDFILSQIANEIVHGNSSGWYEVLDNRETNGDILRPATWNAPAKHARGNLFDNFGGMKSSYGPA